MKTASMFLLVVAIGFAASGCKKEKDEPQAATGTTGLAYQSLAAESNSLGLGATTHVTATATGTGLTYEWSATAGDIIGSGSQVIYGASSCCTGDNTITCVVTDAANTQQTKTVTITVHL